MFENFFKIALAICNCQVGEIALNMEAIKKQVSEAVKNGAHLICFPEMNITGYYNNHDIRNWSLPRTTTEIETLSSFATRSSITILAGFSEIDANSSLFATHGIFFPNGQKKFYRKLHISPPEKEIFEKGDEVPVFEYHGIKFGVQLCYDAHFPELSTVMSLKGVDLIFFPTLLPEVILRKKNSHGCVIWQPELLIMEFMLRPATSAVKMEKDFFSLELLLWFHHLVS